MTMKCKFFFFSVRICPAFSVVLHLFPVIGIVLNYFGLSGFAKLVFLAEEIPM